MITEVTPTTAKEVVYPTSDGQPMADNTKQFRWIDTIVGGLQALFRERADVFVAGDLLWYPVEGEIGIRRAPDAMVAFGRPKGDRGAYLQWREGGIAPQVVFEVLSPGNTLTEMGRKFLFYDLYGVEEYYIYDPDRNDLSGWQRRNGRLDVIEELNGWTSPLLAIRFELLADDLRIIRPDGQPFLSYVELEQRAEQQQQRAEQQQQRAERLAERLRALGVDPDSVENNQ